MHIWRFGVAANSLSGDLKHMSHLQKTLMPFVLVCLLVHLCGVSDALLRSSCAMTDCDLFLIGFSFGSLVCTVFSPWHGSWVTLIVWCVSLFPSGLWNSLPPEYFMACAMALGIIGYFQLNQGLALAAVVSGMSWFLPLIGHEEKDIDAGSCSQRFFLILVMCLVPALIGGLMQQTQRQMELRDMVRRQEEKLEIAHTLHDYVTDDVVDAILLLGQVQDADSVKLDEAKGCLRKASLRSHALIEQLEDVHHANDEDSGITDVSRGQVDGDEVLRALCEIARTHQSRLELLGFDGAVLLPELISGDDCMERETILLGLVRELFADVAKHADARYGYVLTVEASLNEYLIRLRDVAAADASIESGGTGLSRYEAQLKRQGGYLRTQCEDVESGLHWWSLEARVPRNVGNRARVHWKPCRRHQKKRRSNWTVSWRWDIRMWPICRLPRSVLWHARSSARWRIPIWVRRFCWCLRASWFPRNR